METASHKHDDALTEWLHLDAASDESDRALQTMLSASAMPVREGFKESVLESVRLEGMLREARIPVREGFREDVLEALPTPAWRRAPQKAASRTLWPVAAMVFFALGAAMLLSGGAEGHFFATGGAMFDFLSASLTAGSGLFAASWSGAGQAVGGWLQADAGSLIGFGVLVVFANLLFFSLLRRRRTATERASGDR